MNALALNSSHCRGYAPVSCASWPDPHVCTASDPSLPNILQRALSQAQSTLRLSQYLASWLKRASAPDPCIFHVLRHLPEITNFGNPIQPNLKKQTWEATDMGTYYPVCPGAHPLCSFLCSFLLDSLQLSPQLFFVILCKSKHDHRSDTERHRPGQLEPFLQGC